MGPCRIYCMGNRYMNTLSTMVASPRLRVFCFLAFWLWSATGSASLLWTPNLQMAYDSALALKLVRSKELLDLERQANPDNQLVVYVEDVIDFATLLVTENQNEYEALSFRQEKRLEILKQESNVTPWQQFAQAEVLLHWALLKIKFEKAYMSSTLDLRKAFQLLEANAKQYPQFRPTCKTLGMMQVIVGTTPGSYRWLLRLLGFQATAQQGLANLRKAASPQSEQSTEAGIFLANTYTYVLKQPQMGVAIMDSLLHEHPDNVVLGFFYSTALIKEGNSARALKVLQSLPKSYPYLPVYMISYYMGNALLWQGQYQDAIRHYHHFLTYYQGESNVTDAWYKMYLAATLQGNKAAAVNYRAKGMAVPKQGTEADKHALKQLKEGRIPEPTLMKARLFCDGGYHQQAYDYLRMLDPTGYSSAQDRAEYAYRMGRIFTGLHQPDSSAKYYHRVILLSATDHYYFEANAALELGYYYRERNQNREAATWFRHALDVPDNAYSEGIDRKAEAALDEIEP